MRLEEVLAHPPRVLTPEQRALYFEQGYLHLEDFVSSDWIERLQSASARLIEQSRPLTESNEMFVLDQGHCAEVPRLRRLNRHGGLRRRSSGSTRRSRRSRTSRRTSSDPM